MAENSNIEWTHHTFNAWIGCTKVGPGCDNCYAEAWDARGLQGQEARWGPHAKRTRTAPANWRKPLSWDRAAAKAGERHRVFCSSLADVFDNHASILPEWRADLWALIRATPNLDWMLLTKRPGNIAKMLPEDWGRGYPNVWLGCTVVNQAEADRDIPKLLDVPARVRFLSMEPLLGPVNILKPQFGAAYCAAKCKPGCLARGDEECPQFSTGDLDLVIVGGESGPRARPMHPDLARSLRDQCVAAGVPFFFKQWGEWAPAGQVAGVTLGNDASGRPINIGSALRTGQAVAMDGCWSYRVGKARAGRLLDGRTWDQMPGVAHG